MTPYAVLLLVLAAGIVALFGIEALERRRRNRRRRATSDPTPPAWVNDGKPVAVQPHELSDAELCRALAAYFDIQVGAALEYQRLLRERATRHVAASGTAAAERHAQAGGAT